MREEARKNGNGEEIGENVRAWTDIVRIYTSDYKELTKTSAFKVIIRNILYYVADRKLSTKKGGIDRVNGNRNGNKI